ncbi:zinc finger protein 91-like [Episyrphus balteatus]|uniref:zinc finger protein 91-like n=1 Tax=Episyrphus balteatus TaxID=286459 RepID=UPI0024857259|nr:zinc finger protein 91-like [Episyrphus balteatus]
MLEKSFKREKTCRACTKTELELVSLFDKQIVPGGLCYSDMITECTMYTLQQDDALPPLICYECTDKVRAAYEFKKQFEESQNKLLALLESKKEITIEPVEAIFYNVNNEIDDTNESVCSRRKSTRSNSNRESSSVQNVFQEEPIDDQINTSTENTGLNKCPNCSKVFVRMGHLKNHINKWHKEVDRLEIESIEKVVVKCEKAEFYVSTIKEIQDVIKPESDEEEDGGVDFGNDNSEDAINFPDTETIQPVKAEIDETDTQINSMEISTISTHEKTKEKKQKVTSKKDKIKISKEKKPINPERRFQCEICEKSFKRNSHLKQHLLCHTKVKPYECTICHKKFGRTDNLRVHMSSHGKKQFECDSCERSFGQAYLLKRHKEQTHSEEKPYLCSECGQRFVRNGDLAVHMRRHTGEKPYKCQYCNKGFTRSTEVYVHERYHTGEKKHVCNICGKAFQRPYNLVVHVRTHTGERPYQCPHCPKNFAQCSDLKAHIRRHTGERYKCDQCSMGFIHVFVLNQHKRNVHGVDVPSRIIRIAKLNKEVSEPTIRRYDDFPHQVCLECMQRVRSAYELKKQFERSHRKLLTYLESINKITVDIKPDRQNDKSIQTEDTTLYPCEKCDDMFMNLQDLRRHRETIHKGTANDCRFCPKKFNRIGDLKNHIAMHHSDKKYFTPHECLICSRKFARKEHVHRHMEKIHKIERTNISKEEDNKPNEVRDHLKTHMIKHDVTREFKCAFCKRSYDRAPMLKRHLDKYHNPDGSLIIVKSTEWNCEVCKKPFSSKAYLQKHMNKHTNKAWKCKLCPIGFETRAALKEHNKSHGKEKPFLCSECGLRFVRNDYLLIHMRRHTGEKPYTCKYCGKGFPRATDLNVHVKYHTGEKTHLCTVCGKGFQRSYNLVVHMRVHTGERPYKCLHCPKDFAQCNDLKAHVRRHTGERFKCDICGDGFIQGYHLTQHKIEAHGFEGERKGRVTKVKPSQNEIEDADDLPKTGIKSEKKAKPNQSTQMKKIKKTYRSPMTGIKGENKSSVTDVKSDQSIAQDPPMTDETNETLVKFFKDFQPIVEKEELSGNTLSSFQESIFAPQHSRKIAMEFDIEKMCRVCLKTNLESVLLFEEPKKIGGVSISDMISELTIYKVHRHDEFPHLICYECIERVENAYAFKKDFEQSHRKLVTYLDSINKYQAVGDIKPIPTEEKSTQTIDSTLYPCEKCDQKFIKYERLREHRAVAHKGSANLCRICNKSFNRLAGLKSHISAAHPEIGYHNSSNQCYVCNKMFTRRDHVTRHIRNVHKIHTSGMDLGLEITKTDNSEECTNPIVEEGECNADGVLKSEIKQLIECLVCYKNFSSPNRLNRHMMKIHQLDSTNILKQEQNSEMNTFENEVELLAEPDVYRNYSNEDDEGHYDNEDIGGNDVDDDDDDDEDESDEDDEDDDDADADDNDGDDNEANDSKNDDGLNSSGDAVVTNTEFVAANSFIKCEAETLQVPPSTEEIKKVTIKQEKPDFNITEIIYKPPKQEKNTKNESTFDCFHRIEDGKFGCNLCEKTFKSSYHVKRHFLSHTQEKAFPCTMCEMRFNRADHLKNHMTKHNPVKPFQCDSCDASYGRADHLKRHKEMHHSNDPNATPIKGEVCEICNKSYSSKSYLQKHMLKHTEKCWKCKLCSVVFETNEALKEHSKTHSKDKPFLCSECGLCFPRKNYLIIHMRRHNGERPYKCQYCDKGFPRSTDLKAHEKCHTGEKTHFCNVCGKGFPRPYKLSVHMRIHTGEKPYQCMHCPKAFAQCNDLKAHIRRHTGERFRCELCGAGFIQKYNLTQHKADAHGIIKESRLGRVVKVNISEPPHQVLPEVVMNDPDEKLQMGQVTMMNPDPVDKLQMGLSTMMNNPEEKMQMALATSLVFRGVTLH